MSEATPIETTEPAAPAPSLAEVAALADAARALDRARILQIGSFHAALVLGALTLWGAAATWAQVTGWTIAHFAALANAVVAGFVIPSTVHEWGHFLGARLSGATSPVFEAPKRHYFLFDFPIAENDLRQFAWMSWGGILAPWLPVLLALLLVPSGAIGGHVLLATLVFKAVAVAAFEVPVVRAAVANGDPAGELGRRVQAGALPRSRNIGAAAGLALFALLWLAA